METVKKRSLAIRITSRIIQELFIFGIAFGALFAILYKHRNNVNFGLERSITASIALFYLFVTLACAISYIPYLHQLLRDQPKINENNIAEYSNNILDSRGRRVHFVPTIICAIALATFVTLKQTNVINENFGITLIIVSSTALLLALITDIIVCVQYNNKKPPYTSIKLEWYEANFVNYGIFENTTINILTAPEVSI